MGGEGGGGVKEPGYVAVEDMIGDLAGRKLAGAEGRQGGGQGREGGGGRETGYVAVRI